MCEMNEMISLKTDVQFATSLNMRKANYIYRTIYTYVRVYAMAGHIPCKIQYTNPE